jgi:hypothetical protein
MSLKLGRVSAYLNLSPHYSCERQEKVSDANYRAFGFFRGAFTLVIYDNIKTSLDAIFVGKNRQFSLINADRLALFVIGINS